MWYVYVARCSDGSLYTGVTTDLHARLERHNSGRGSKYVRAKGTAMIVYAEEQPSRSAAQRREWEIKSWERRKKLTLIAESSLGLRPRDSLRRPRLWRGAPARSQVALSLSAGGGKRE